MTYATPKLEVIGRAAGVLLGTVGTLSPDSPEVSRRVQQDAELGLEAEW
jgi:hypothetical protein